jgi:hypothetical protein
MAFSPARAVNEDRGASRICPIVFNPSRRSNAAAFGSRRSASTGNGASSCAKSFSFLACGAKEMIGVFA